MKLPVLNIPLVWFPSLGSFLAAIFFGLASVDALKELAEPDFDSVCATISFGISALTLACSIALFLKRDWARRALIWTLSSLAVLIVVTAIHDVVKKSLDQEDVVFRLVASPFLITVLALHVAFLLNKPVVSELNGRENERA